jgi:hypothetical protein
MTVDKTPPAKPTCATCQHWARQHDPDIPALRECVSPVRTTWMPEHPARVWTGAKITCPHHTPRTDDDE